MLALTACRAAYTGGEEWLTQLLQYLKENIDYIRTYLRRNLPKVKLVEPEGTYLIWLDFSAYGYTAKELDDKMIHEAGIWLDAGVMFGPEGDAYERVNIACPRSIVVEAMERMKRVFEP